MLFATLSTLTDRLRLLLLTAPITPYLSCATTAKRSSAYRS